MELHGNVAEDIWGPKCNECMINSGDPMQFVRLNLAERKFMQTYYGNIRRICRYCLHNIIYNSHMAWWKFTSRGHVILDNPDFASRITSYLWRTVCWQNCRCGDCDPSWFIRGWRCWGLRARWEHRAFMADPFRATCVRWVLPMDSDDDLIVSHTSVYIAQSFCEGKCKGQPGSATTGLQSFDI